jgi:hypothetical protein
MNGITPPIGEPHSWDEVYKWELEEVYLLLDFIAGRPDKRLTSLEVEVSEEVADEADPTKKTVKNKKLSAPEIAKRISALRFPPEGPDMKRSQEAAFLLIVKDRLCALAYPATAQSIAFTDLVASKTTMVARSIWGPFRWLRKVRMKPEASHARPRVSVGRRAFPDLEEIAVSFCKFQKTATFAAVAFALIGALLLAEATYGGQLTSRLQAAKRDATAAAAAIYSTYGANHLPQSPGGQPARVQNICPLPQEPSASGAINAKDRPNEELASAASPPAPDVVEAASVAQVKPVLNKPVKEQTQRVDLIGNMDPKLIQLCDDYAYAAASFQNAVADVDAYARSPVATLVSWVVPIHKLDPGTPKCAGRSDLEDCGAKQETGPSVSGMVSAFANYILPLIFGLVGALSGTTRIIQDKILDSVLVPRDNSLLWLRVLLGGIAGGSVGLFFDPSKVAADITSGNSGLSVSASGIAFLAGYGAPAFFGMLDTILARVFNLSDNRRPTGGASEGRPS